MYCFDVDCPALWAGHTAYFSGKQSIPRDPSAQGDEAGMFGEMTGQPPFPRAKRRIANCKLQDSQNAPFKTWCEAYDSYGFLLTILASFTLKSAGLEYDD